MYYFLEFSGNRKHQNPDETLFEKEQIITPAILTRASVFLREKDRGFPEKDMRGMIAIEAVMPLEVQEKIHAAEKKGGSFPFFPQSVQIKSYSATNR